MLMAAGLGTRLRPFTELETKALLPVMSVPCAQFALDRAVEAGVKKLVANVHHHAEHAKEGLEKLKRGAADLIVSDESSLLLGSAGGIAKALPHFEGQPFFLLNADVLCDVDLNALARRHRLLKERNGVLMTLTIFQRPLGSGSYREIFLDHASGLISGLGEVVQGKPYFVGAAVLESEALAGISGEEPSEFLPRILEPSVRAGRAGFFLAQGLWFDIGSPELWAETHFSLMKALETGALPRQWRNRIEASSHRIAPGMWISKRARRGFHSAEWRAPVYFGDLGDSTAAPPRDFGPNAVLYGQSKGASLQKKMVYRGISVNLG